MSRDLGEQAISELVTKIDPSVSLPLLGTVIQSGNPEIGRTALNLIRRHRFLPAIRVMLDVAKNPGSSSDVICNVVDTIGEIGDANAQNVLMGLLRHDYLMVRRRAAVALGRIGTPSAVSQLRQCAGESGQTDAFVNYAYARLKRSRSDTAAHRQSTMMPRKQARPPQADTPNFVNMMRHQVIRRSRTVYEPTA